ncbi:MAG: response regulator transcription factor [Oscillospiraceae bacterium]|nr:response regulator transcription factor [Oscillospiraceae bacterium]
MLKIALCDDNADFVACVTQMLEQWPGRPCDLSLSCFTDGDALVHAHSASSFDIILLDMVMPLMDGIETAREIRATDPVVKIVFLTASPEFAVESYRVKAYDYLLKPLQPQLLYGCLDELKVQLQQAEKYIMVRTTVGTHRIRLEQIECVEAQNKHTLFTVALAGGKEILESIEPMHRFEDRLLAEDGFFRCHRSYFINLYQVDSFNAKEARTRTGCCVPIARAAAKEFEAAYFDLMFGKVSE